jgi:hypothetical protein
MTTAVRTGGPGAGGISVLVIDTKSHGFSARKIKNTGNNAGGRIIASKNRRTHLTFARLCMGHAGERQGPRRKPGWRGEQGVSDPDGK